MKRGTKIECECGLITDAAYLSRHRAGIFHTKHDRIRSLLEKDCLTFVEIGKRLGVTRERIRQIAKDMGILGGHDRRRVCSLTRAFDAFLDSGWPAAEAAIDLRTRNITAEPEVTRDGYSPHLLTAAGKSCWVGRLCRRDGRNPYYQINPPKHQGRVDFMIFQSECGWLVLPYDKVPKRTTMFVLGRPMGCTGAIRYRHDWSEYLNAWHLLRRQAQ